jgi:hypothetical protein
MPLGHTAVSSTLSEGVPEVGSLDQSNNGSLARITHTRRRERERERDNLSK